jgi:citrate lyase subunit beta/citryl-CoA lyase
MMAKAAASDADEVFLDLEDATAPSEKDSARSKAIEALRSLEFGRKTRTVRVNAVTTPYCYRDIIEVVSGAGANLDCILLPKPNSARDLHFVDQLLAGLEAHLGLDRRIGLECLIETAAGAVNVREISTATERLEALIFGPGDYAYDLGVTRLEIGTADPRYPGHQWQWAMCEVVNHARAAGLQAIDGPCVDFTDEDGYRQLALRARLLGFEGKWCIHPNQIPWATETFSVAPEELARAKRFSKTYSEAASGGLGATTIDGLMVDDATRKMAELTIARARRERTAQTQQVT